MFLRELLDPIEKIKGAGPAASRILAAAGITGVGQLLSRYPRDYEDRSRAVPLRDWRGGPVCTTARVIAHDWFGFGAMKTLKVYIEDSGDRACLVCFNRPFLQKTLSVGERIRVWGRFYYKYGELQASAFETDAEGGKKFGAILPVYPLSSDLSQALLRKLTKNALEQYGAFIEDEVPAPVAESESLLHKGEAVKIIHYPPSREALEKARNTLVYEELFYLETLVGRRALERGRMARLPSSLPASGGTAAGTLSALQRQLVERLPFDLTAGQTGALAEINADLAGARPMARLLQGDVGSGKTLVAFLAALAVIEGGGQAALMAPTELLARQHAENAARLLEPLGIRPAYLSGNLKAAGRRELLRALAAGEIDLALGTHALFSAGVNYRALRMAIIDEQQRFGVIQRQKILARGKDGQPTPHLLMMSATPIPRTLALTVFGDLDVSVIGDMPGGRMPVETHLAKDSNAQKVYDFVRKQLDAGRQAYFVYPLIG
ncbi:MAG: DEAD/DEAH box helicase, partial [Treponema sp.]|nr:DEAD/DEAH box helicase [Treponema sp.]